MIRSTVRFAQLFSALLLFPVVACSSAEGSDNAEPVAMSDAEALNLVENATIREPIGEKVVSLREVGDQVQVTCSQQMYLRLAPGGPGGGGPLNCGGSCKLTAGSKLSDCKTSGCTFRQQLHAAGLFGRLHPQQVVRARQTDRLLHVLSSRPRADIS